MHEVAPPPARRPLFVVLDATWAEARKMFHKSTYLDRFPVLGIAAVLRDVTERWHRDRAMQARLAAAAKPA